MKKFIKILLCFTLCVVSLGFVACGKTAKLSMPATNEAVSSNGGVAVKKGNYVYFANGYYSLDNVTKDNRKQSYENAGLYMAVLTEDGNFTRNEAKEISNAQRLSAKLAGFEASQLYVHRDYLYFVSYNTEVTRNGALKKDNLILYRIKLDGTNLKEVYSSSNSYKDGEGKITLEFNYFEKDNDLFVLVKNGNSLYRVVCNNDSIGGVSTVSSNILSYAFDKSGTLGNIYFTTKSDDVYTVNRYNVYNNKIETKKECDSADKIDSLFEVKFERLYAYVTFDGSASYLYSISLQDFENFGITEASMKKLTATNYSNVYLLGNYLDGILVKDNAGYKLIDAQNPLESMKNVDNLPSDVTIMTIQGGYVYYYKDKQISRWNYTKDENNNECQPEAIVEETNTIANYAYDIVDNYIYYFVTINTNNYLFRANVGISENNTSEIVGNYLSSDAPKVEEE